MDKQSNSTPVPESIGELSANIIAAVAAKRERDVAVASAMRGLETHFYDLANMTGIMANLFFSAFDDISANVDTEEADRLNFAVNEVERRVDALKEAYLAAWDAGKEA
ncbi:hypothetical protein [Rhizobium sp.]|uniref:hypothetical protein n=1 Tax=Rhizobium sp. TaxID=391 RepID=UPI0028A70DFC